MLISERARMKKRYHQWFARPEACQLAPLRIHVVATCLNTCMSAPAIINMYVYAVHVCVLFSYETSHTHKGVISVFMCSWQSCNTCTHTFTNLSPSGNLCRGFWSGFSPRRTRWCPMTSARGSMTPSRHWKRLWTITGQ